MCNAMELLDLVISICQDPRKAYSPEVDRQIERLLLLGAEDSANITSVEEMVAKMEAMQQALESLQEKERRGRLQLAEAKRVNLALEEANRARSMEAQALSQELQAAYKMHEDLTIELLADYNKVKQGQEAKRGALSAELAAVQEESELWKAEASAAKDKCSMLELARTNGVAALVEQEALHRQECARMMEELRLATAAVEAAQQESNMLREESQESKAQGEALRLELAQKLEAAYTMQDDILTEHQKKEEEKKALLSNYAALQNELARTKVEMESSDLAAETAQGELVAAQEELARFKAAQQDLLQATNEGEASFAAALQEELDRAKVERGASHLAAETARRELEATQEELAQFQAAQQELLDAAYEGQESLVVSLQEELARTKVEMEASILASETAERELIALQEEYAQCQTLLMEARAYEAVRDTMLRALRENMTEMREEVMELKAEYQASILASETTAQ